MKSKTNSYKALLRKKIIAASNYGIKIDRSRLSPLLLPHQGDIVHWCLTGGRRAIFASFGLGKTVMQLELARLVMEITGKPFLICMPLGVVGEFREDNELIQTGYNVRYITDTDSLPVQKAEFEVIEAAQNTDSIQIEKKKRKYIKALKIQGPVNLDLKLDIYVTNYERVRMGDIDPAMFGGVSFDEASILRNLQTETTNYVLKHFSKVKYRFVATATPTPNDYIEILNYAEFLGVIDRGHALTRFFQRNSEKAGDLTLYENKKEEFWRWVATWAVFINRPSDLGYDDTGYILPELKFKEVEIENLPDGPVINKDGDIVMFKDLTKGLVDTSREKAATVDMRVQKAYELVQEHGPDDHWILWHHLEAERKAIEKTFKAFDLRTVYGPQKRQLKEDLLIGFKNSEYKILSTKPEIAGSGCNFQKACHKMIFVGINYKFNDFIQAIHRVYRFMQAHQVEVWAIFTNNEREVLKELLRKWRQHIEQQTFMIDLVRKYGLNSDKITQDMKRQIFDKPRSAKVGNATVYNNDTVFVHEQMESNTVGMHLSSWPFGDHYEYSDNYNDFGHNDGNAKFFEQMDYLTPHLLRTLKPGRIMAVHVKDRIMYSYKNQLGFTTIDPFSDDVVAHCRKHGFHYCGRITITTDVVRENKQTNRLQYKEQRKDATKMGVGLPEYVLLFRKAPTGTENSYADDPVIKKIDDYLLSLWQLDAHSYWKSSGNRFMSFDEMAQLEIKPLMKLWKQYDSQNIYNFQEHLRVCEDLSLQKRLPKVFMAVPPISTNDFVWTDINRMNTLNASQANQKKEKHICPLQLDIIRRLINRFTMMGDLVDDCFGGLFSTPYVALEMGRHAVAAELKPEYYDDGLFYLKAIEYKINVPTLFDMVDLEQTA